MGNPITPTSWTFTVYDPDLDDNGDGFPDALEAVYGGGDADFDRDALSNRGELLLGLDPSLQDTDGDGILDGAGDPDELGPFTAFTDHDRIFARLRWDFSVL